MKESTNMALPAKICAYSILAEVGSGGMGTVYRARDANGREVALKVMSPELMSSAAARERFRLESMLHPLHSNIVQVFDAGICAGQPFFAMQFVEGPTLEDMLHTGRSPNGRLAMTEVLSILRNIAAALDTAHMRGVIHRDVKPSNILVRNKDKVAFLTDFGVAKTSSVNMTQVGGNAGPRIGTPRYMAPEQANGLPPTPQSDIYSLAIVVYEALAGRPPFIAKDSKVLLDMQRKEKPPDLHTLVAVPKTVSAVLARALSKDPSQRYATAGDFALAFEQAAQSNRRTRNRLMSVGVGLVAMTVLIGMYWGWSSGMFDGPLPVTMTPTPTLAPVSAKSTDVLKVKGPVTVEGSPTTIPPVTPSPAPTRVTATPQPTDTPVATSTRAPTLTPTHTPRPFTRTPTPNGGVAPTKAP